MSVPVHERPSERQLLDVDSLVVHLFTYHTAVHMDVGYEYQGWQEGSPQCQQHELPPLVVISCPEHRQIRKEILVEDYHLGQCLLLPFSFTKLFLYFEELIAFVVEFLHKIARSIVSHKDADLTWCPHPGLRVLHPN